jgi:hypothetical protein
VDSTDPHAGGFHGAPASLDGANYHGGKVQCDAVILALLDMMAIDICIVMIAAPMSRSRNQRTRQSETDDRDVQRKVALFKSYICND